MATVQGLNSVIEISTDGGTVYKFLICEIKNGVKLKTDTTSQATKCNAGTTVTGVGASSWSVDFDAVDDDAPLSTQESYAALAALWLAKTLVHVRVKSVNGGTTAFTHAGDAYLTDLSLDNTVNDVTKFSGTFTGTGAIVLS